MGKSKNLLIWVETGYNLFAEEGLEGLQVERLARITNLNKSGFYHYFHDFDMYCEHLLWLHEHTADRFMEGLQKAKNIEPDFVNLLIEFKAPVMFQMRLIQIKNKPSFHKVASIIHEREDALIVKVWSDYLGVQSQAETAIGYFNIVRDMFYARISFQNYNYDFIRDLLAEARVILNKLAEGKALEAEESVRILKGDESVRLK
jgi:AcrR family transcriptional regulator